MLNEMMVVARDTVAAFSLFLAMSSGPQCPPLEASAQRLVDRNTSIVQNKAKRSHHDTSAVSPLCPLRYSVGTNSSTTMPLVCFTNLQPQSTVRVGVDRSEHHKAVSLPLNV